MSIEDILKIMDRFDSSNMTSFCFQDDKHSLTLESKKEVIAAESTSVIPVAIQGGTEVTGKTEEAEVKDTKGTVIHSPLVGTFYAAKAEGEKPYVSVGDKVTKGQTIGIIEAMKLMNEVEAESDGIVAEIYVENEQLVEYGQPLVRLV